MDKAEARIVLSEFLKELKTRPPHDLVALISNPQVKEVRFPSGSTYQIEYESIWDQKPGGDLRIIVSIDDGSLRSSLCPITSDFIIRKEALHSRAD